MPVFDVRPAEPRLMRVLRGRSGGRLLGALRVSADVELIRDARAFVRQTLDAQAVAASTVDDAALIVSELLTNVALHTSGGLGSEAMIKLIVAGRHLRIEVHDASPLFPSQRATSDEAEHGRGLTVVEGLAGRWGWELAGEGKFVWCELAAWAEQTATDRA